MGNGMNKVLPGLYVGNYRDSKDLQQLEKYQITHIIAIHDSPRRLLPDKHYLCVMASDTPDQNLSQYFSVCNDFIHAARLREGNVLIHCLAGMSRSVTVAVAYIMSATNLNWKEALKVVRAGRAVANPNVGFQNQLQEFETYRLVEERKRLKERFPSTALEQTDMSKCLSALNSYQELLQNKDICEGNCARGEKCPTGVCNMDPTKGIFRRRPSTASTRSRLHSQAASNAGATGLTVASVKSCPTSPKHSPGGRRSLGEQLIPEDEEANVNPTTSSEAASYAAAVTAAATEQLLQQREEKQQMPQNKLETPQIKSSTSKSSTPPRTCNTRTLIAVTKFGAEVHQSNSSTIKVNDKNVVTRRSTSLRVTNTTTSPSGGIQLLHRSASTISGIAVRPRSSPTGLHSYTGSVPSSVHGSRVDLSNTDKGSAIYLGCSAPRNSNWSLVSSRGSSGSSAPSSPAHTPPISPRDGVRRSVSNVKKKQG